MVDAQNVAKPESTPDPRRDEGASAQSTADGSAAGGARVRRVPVRRAPNIVAFVLTGAVLGFIVGALINEFGPVAGVGAGTDASLAQALNYSSATALFYLGTVGLLLGAGVGALVAVLLDRRR